MADTKIEWAEKVWNPIAGCTKCSPGCLNCYAERMAHRLKHMCLASNFNPQYLGKTDYEGNWTGKVECCVWKLDEPLHWRKPRRIFVCSMSDLFHEKVPFSFVTRLHDRIDVCQQHTFVILTKRITQAKRYYLDYLGGRTPENVHLGVSICTPDEMWKATELSRIPAAVRIISFEPLLADVGEIPLVSCREDDNDLEEFGRHIDGVIVGGESGAGARPMHPDWVRSIRDQCVAAGVDFYFKQWGEWLSGADKYALKIKTYQHYYPKRVTRVENTTFFRVGKKKAGRLLDGKIWDQLPKGGDAYD